MKLSVAVSTAEAPPSAFVVFRGIEESIRKAAELGYGGIELAIGSSGDVDFPVLDRLLAGYNLEVSAISTGLVIADRGISFLGTPEKARQVFFELIDAAADYGKKINIGRVRGFKKGLTFAESATALKRTISPLCEYAARKNVEFLVEPVNRYEIDWIHNIDEGMALLKYLDFANIRLMPDVFHMNIEDPDIPGKLEECGASIGYIHLADSNRHAPGRGHIDFPSVFNALKKIGYEGWASIEILPVPDPDTAARESALYLKPLLEHYNGSRR